MPTFPVVSLKLTDIVLDEDVARHHYKNDEICRMHLREWESKGGVVIWSKHPDVCRKVDLPESVYFILCPALNRVKIGFSAELGRRIKTHMTSCPFPVETLKTIPGGRAVESRIHKQFAHLRRHLEWFEATPELLSYIQTL